MDANEERLCLVRRLAVRYAEEVGFDLRLERTMDREEALRDAYFVISTASAGGHGNRGFVCIHNVGVMLAAG